MNGSSQKNLLHLSVDAGMLASIRRTVIGACGDRLKFLRIEPIAQSGKLQMQVCLTSDAEKEHVLAVILRKASAVKASLVAVRHTAHNLIGILLPGKPIRHGAHAEIREASRPQLLSENGKGHNSPRKGSDMNHVTQILSAEDILLDLDASTKKRVFEEIGRHFEKRHGIPQRQVVESLIARENLGSTGLGQGVALPHARIRHLTQAMAAFVQLELPIDFDSPDAKPVSDMLILLVPEHATEQHLQILAEFAQMLGDRDFREKIRTCGDADAVYKLFSDWPQA